MEFLRNQSCTTILVSVFVIIVFDNVLSGADCGGKCTCDDVTMTCTGTSIPRVPEHVTRVQLVETDFERVRKIFEGDPENWPRVTHLAIHSLNSTALSGGVFQLLKSLVYLKVHCEMLNKLDETTFYGLNSLTILDLSLNYKLSSSEVKNAFQGATGQQGQEILPSLTALNLSYLGQNIFPAQDMDLDFYNTISRDKTIRYLDISGISFKYFETRHFYSLCNRGLEHLILKAAKLSHLGNWVSGFSCKLQTLDFEGMSINSGLILLLKGDQVLSSLDCKTWVFYFSIRTIRLDRIFRKEVVQHFNTYLNFSLPLAACQFHTEHLYLSRNYLPISFTYMSLHNITKQTLKTMDLSYNRLNYISPLVSEQLQYLICLNVSNNVLFEMQRDKPDEFVNMFAPMLNIEEIRMADNGLKDLPGTMFSKNTNLSTCDLSNNKLKTIRFDISNLFKLKLLNLSNNYIMEIESSTFNVIKGIDHLNLLLNNNPVNCECDRITTDLLDWVLSEHDKHTTTVQLNCHNEGDMFNIAARNQAVQLKDKCLLKTTRRNLAVSLPTCILFIAIAVTLVIVQRRRQLRKDEVRRVINKIQKNDLPWEFLTFLCFASDDHEVVENHVYQHMDRAFREITGVDRDFVCKGDLSFRPGFHIMNETARCVEKCAVVVAAVSNTFCQRHWCEKEMMHGYNIGKPIVLIMLENIERKLMPEVVARSFNTFVHAALVTENNETRAVPSWPNMCKSIIELAGKENNVGDGNIAFQVLKGQEEVAANHVQNI